MVIFGVYGSWDVGIGKCLGLGSFVWVFKFVGKFVDLEFFDLNNFCRVFCFEYDLFELYFGCLSC